MISFKDIGYNSFLKALLASLALITGGVIYILIRPSEVIFARIISNNPFTIRLKEISKNFLWQNNEVPEWILYSLPDGMWAFAYSLLITSIWSGHSSKANFFWILSIPCLTIGFEVFQLFGLLPGTFCLTDMCFLIIGISAGFLIGKNSNLKT